MKKIKSGKTYSLDVGDLAPIEVKIVKINKDDVVCEYMHSWANRMENISKEIFKMNGYSI